MPRNDPAQDRYNPSSVSITDFENHKFSELEEDELFWLTQNPNGDVNLVHRKISLTEGVELRTQTAVSFGPNDIVYQKI